MKITVNRYDNYDERVKEYMSILIKSLEREYRTIDDQWLISLDLIAQNYAAYLVGWDDLQKYGMYITDEKNRIQRNPALTIMNNSQAYLQKLLHSFALNPMAKSQIKKPDVIDENDYLETL